VEEQGMRGRQFSHALEDAALAGYEAHREIAIERFPIDAAGKRGVRHESLQLRREAQGTVRERVEERLLAGAVARHENGASRRVVEREGKHAIHARDAIDAPLAIRGKDDFRVRAGAEHVAFRDERIAEVREVVDLAVEDDMQRSADVRHRLMTCGGQVDDGKPPVPETDAAVLGPPFSAAVRAAVMQCVAARAEPVALGRGRSRRYADNPAHGAMSEG
jgi:hypothetical protein